MHARVQAVHTALAACSKAVADEWLDFLEGVTKVLRTKNRLVFRTPDGSYCSAAGARGRPHSKSTLRARLLAGYYQAIAQQ